MGNFPGPVERPGSGTRRANYQECRNSSSYLRRRPEHNNQLHDRKPPPMIGSALGQQYPITVNVSRRVRKTSS
jgi:hypothetical protein